MLVPIDKKEFDRIYELLKKEKERVAAYHKELHDFIKMIKELGMNNQLEAFLHDTHEVTKLCESLLGEKIRNFETAREYLDKRGNYEIELPEISDNIH